MTDKNTIDLYVASKISEFGITNNSDYAAFKDLLTDNLIKKFMDESAIQKMKKEAINKMLEKSLTDALSENQLQKYGFLDSQGNFNLSD